jgi:hypothetical protein
VSPDYAANLHPAALDWIHRCYSWGRAHGALLAEDLGRGWVMDSPRLANEILEVWESNGWISRDPEPTPTRSQLFGGVGGRSPGHKPNAFNAYPCEFGYQVNHDSPSLKAFVTS